MLIFVGCIELFCIRVPDDIPREGPSEAVKRIVVRYPILSTIGRPPSLRAGLRILCVYEGRRKKEGAD